MESEVKQRNSIRLFNTSIEIGVRALVVLTNFAPLKIDFQKLLYLDYMLVNSGDVNGPESMHPKIPYRASSIGIRRKDLADGLDLLLSRGLVNKEYSSTEGVLFGANEIASNFLDYFESPYYKVLNERATWLKVNFERFETNQLLEIVKTNSEKWSAEFSLDNLTRNDWYE